MQWKLELRTDALCHTVNSEQMHDLQGTVVVF